MPECVGVTRPEYLAAADYLYASVTILLAIPNITL